MFFAGALRDDGRGQDGREERSGRDLAPDFVQHHNQFTEARSGTPVGLGEMDAQPAQVRHVLPERGRGSVSASRRARLAASAPLSVSTRRTDVPSSWCSSVMAIGMAAPLSAFAFCVDVIPSADAARPLDTTEHRPDEPHTAPGGPRMPEAERYTGAVR